MVGTETDAARPVGVGAVPPERWSGLVDEVNRLGRDPQAAVALLSKDSDLGIPQPGAGETLERWAALASLGAVDLSVARAIEPHLDAAAILVEAGLLSVVSERRVRGAVERTLALSESPTIVEADDLAAMTPEDHKRGFAAFVAGMLATFDRYVDRGDIDLVRDQVAYRQYALWMTDDEFTGFLEGIGEVYRRSAEQGPAPGRTRRVLSLVSLPARSRRSSTAASRCSATGSPRWRPSRRSSSSR